MPDDDDNVTTAETPFTTDPAPARDYETEELDTTVEDENKAATREQIENREEFTDDPGQLTEDPQGDYQRRVQLGVDPNEIDLANPDAVPDENRREAEDDEAGDDDEK